MIVSLALALAAQALASSAEAGATQVKLFEQTCLAQSGNLAQLPAAIEAAGTWTAADSALLDPGAIGVTQRVPAFQVGFRKPTSVRHWVSADNVHLIFLEFDKKRPEFRHVCAIVVENSENFYPYREGFKAAVEAAHPIKGKNTDVPHLFQMGGKTKDGRFAQAELFTRSAVLAGQKKSGIMYIAVR